MSMQPLGQMIIELGLDSSNFASGMKGVNQQIKSSMIEMKSHLNIMGRSGSEVDKLKARQDGLTKVVEAQNKKVVQAKEDLNAHKKKMEESGDASQKSKDKLIKLTNEYNTAIGKLSSFDNQLKEVTIQLNAMQDPTYKLGESMAKVGERMTTFGDAAAKVGKGLTLGVTTPLIAVGAAAIKAAIEWESAFAGVKKTVDEVVDSSGRVVYSYEQIEDALLELSERIPATTTEIAGVAEAAGQLGIATEDVTGFTEVMINLGESTNVSAEDAASSLAKFANITKMSADNYENLGSSIVALGNNFATTESDIIAMSTKLASAGKLAGLSETEILGLATAMSSVGIEAEAGGTAMTQTLTAVEKAVANSGKELDKFAEVAGMSASEFSNTWNNEPIKAIEAFITGLGGLDAKGESATLTLDELGLTGIRQSNMLKSLALSAENMSAAVDMSSAAWSENTALTEEASKRYETTESQIQILKNTAGNAAKSFGELMLPAIKDITSGLQGLTSWVSNLTDGQKKMIVKVAAFAAAVGPVVLVVGKLSSGIGKLTTAVGKYLEKQALSAASKKVDAAATAAQNTATAAQTAAESAGATATVGATAARRASTTATGAATTAAGAHTTAVTAEKVATDAAAASATALNVALGVLAVAAIGIIALVAVFKDLGTETSIAKQNIKDINATYEESVASAEASATAAGRLVNELEALEEQGLSTNAEQRRYKSIVEELNILMPDLNLEIDEHTGLIKQDTSALKDNIEEIKTQAKEQAKAKQQADLLENWAKAVNKVDDALYKMKTTQKEQEPLLEKMNELTGLSTDSIHNLAIAAAKGAWEQRDYVLSLAENREEAALLIDSLIDLASEENKQNEIVQENRDAVDKYAGQLGELGTTVETTDDLIAASAEETAEAVSNSAAGAASAVEASVDTIKNRYADLEVAQKSALDGIVSAYETMTGGLSDLTTGLVEQDGRTWASIKQNQDNTIAQTQEFTELYARAIDAGISGSYLNAIDITGPESNNALRGMLDGNIDEVLASQDKWETAYGTILNDGLLGALDLDDGTKNAISEYVSGEAGIAGALKGAVEAADFGSLGYSIAESAATGIEDGTPIAIAAMEKAATRMELEGWREPLDQHSPSRVFVDLGGGLMESAAIGVTENGHLVVSALRKVTDTLPAIASDAAAKFAQRVTESFTTLKSTLPSMTAVMWLSIKSVFTSNIDYLVGKIKELPSRMGSALISSSGALTDGLVSMWKTAVTGSAAPVNKVLDGANWILGEFGSSKKVAAWTPYASGTIGHPGGNALVNDGRGAELVQMPTGETFIPRGRNVLIPNAPKGMKVLPAEETARLMGRNTPTYKYAGGIGNLLDNIFDGSAAAAAKVKDFALDIYKYISNPEGLIEKVTSSFVNYTGVSGIAKSTGAGLVDTAKEAMVGWAKKLFDEFGGLSLSDYVPSKGVEQWRSTVIRALSMESLNNDTNVSKTLYQMQTESGGNPYAINMWDINAKNGTPSKGLMQVIDPTFNAYARSGFNSNIWDPLSNILASVRYATSRYGSLAKAYRGVGYANGGLSTIEKQAWISEGNKPEMVIPLTNKTRSIELILRALNYLGGGSAPSTSGADETSGIAALLQQIVTQNEKTNALLEALEQKRTTLDGRDIVDYVDNRVGHRNALSARGMAY